MQRRRSHFLLAVWTALALPAAATAQQTMAGSDFRANTHTTGSQLFPEIHYQASGAFVVAWTGHHPLDGSFYGVIARRYDAAGNALGVEFKANTYTTSYQYRPRIASDSRGNFVVVWSSDGQDGSAYGMFGQRFDAAGTPRGAEFQVNTYTTGGQGTSYLFPAQNHMAAMAPNGNFVVVWGSNGNDQDGDGGLGSVQAQRFDAGGNRLGAEFQVNTYTTGREWGPSVGVAADGSFVVAWMQLDGDSGGITSQRFDAGGVRVGSEFQVNTYVTGNQVKPSLSVNGDGSFLVVWFDDPGEVWGRRFDAAANPLGSEFQVNTNAVGLQYTYSASQDKRGNFIVTWNGSPDGSVSGVFGQRFSAAGARRGAEFQVNSYTNDTQSQSAVASDDVGNVTVVWSDLVRDGDAPGVFGQRFGGLRPSALVLDTTGNNVLEPGESVNVQPSWRNINGVDQTFSSGLSNIAGPAGATYTITDAAADYGTVTNGASAACTDCFALAVSNPASRPATHWDASVVESIAPDLQGQEKSWRLHVGRSFADVPSSNPFYRFVETLLHNGVTGGCSARNYCPSNPATREQMAVFVLVAKEGPVYAPQACGGTPQFGDVLTSSPFCRWVEELARRGVVGGCGGGNYCPTGPVTREQMAVFTLLTLDPTLSPPACTTPMFADVPASSPFCRWVEELARRGVVSGCGGGNYCPASPVSREQMGVFISLSFGLNLYGP